MSNVFDDISKGGNQVRTNNFDWSHANNLTTQIGRITPVFAELCPPKSSLRIQPRLGLQFMPMVFPIQTRLKARMAFFRYPLRALWKDYRDYVGNFRQGLVEPYHDFAGQIPATGSLYDYLGLPTTFVGQYGQNWLGASPASFCVTSTDGTDGSLSDIFATMFTRGSNISSDLDESFPASDVQYATSIVAIRFHISDFSAAIRFDVSHALSPFGFVLTSEDGTILDYSVFSSPDASFLSDDGVLISSMLSDTVAFEGGYFYLFSYPSFFTGLGYSYAANVGYSSSSPVIQYNLVGKQSPIEDIDEDNNPYYASGSSKVSQQLKISAYKARAYEGVYNAYYRDIRNNPYYIGSDVQYNQWLPSLDGGADSNKYELHYANWEKDFLTTAVQSPQQGVAPLVGITTYSDTYTNDDGSVTTQQRVALVDEDGRKFGVDFDSDAEGLKDVRYTELNENVPVTQPRSLIDLVNSGISINDLRNVNAYQKFLELNMRQGYSYRDIVQARFQVKVRYSDLLMPEFVGGYTRDVNMNAITQTVMREDNGMYADSLGSQAGVAGVRESNPPTISCYCDEESIVLGILVVTPMPVYTQLLPKDFLYRDLLDHFQPEFNNIGFQPITYQEVCPIQQFSADPSKMLDVFGYQRPWYEYVQKYDVAHGLFRTNMRNFLMNRVFNSRPELNESFLLVDPGQVNDVFAVTETTDKIYGQIWFNIVAKLPISRRAIPRLD